MYKCSICGKEFDKVIDRANCEISCTKKAAEAKKKEEQNARHVKVTKMIDDAYAELNRYVKDYGSYSYNGNTDLPNDGLSLMKLLHDLLF